MSRWFVETRINWILENIRIFGTMRREYIIVKFEISLPQASMDIQEALKRDSRIVYNKSTKQYEYNQLPF